MLFISIIVLICRK